jgi:dachs protein
MSVSLITSYLERNIRGILTNVLFFFFFTGGADASSSNEKVHLKQRLQSLDSELVTLRNRIYVQGENMNALGSTQQSQQQPNSTTTTLHSSHTSNISNAINACHNQTNVLPPTLPKNQIPIPPHLPNTVPHISSNALIFLSLYYVNR